MRWLLRSAAFALCLSACSRPERVLQLPPASAGTQTQFLLTRPSLTLDPSFTLIDPSAPIRLDPSVSEGEIQVWSYPAPLAALDLDVSGQTLELDPEGVTLPLPAQAQRIWPDSADVTGSVPGSPWLSLRFRGAPCQPFDDHLLGDEASTIGASVVGALGDGVAGLRDTAAGETEVWSANQDGPVMLWKGPRAEIPLTFGELPSGDLLGAYDSSLRRLDRSGRTLQERSLGVTAERMLVTGDGRIYLRTRSSELYTLPAGLSSTVAQVYAGFQQPSDCSQLQRSIFAFDPSGGILFADFSGQVHRVTEGRVTKHETVVDGAICASGYAIAPGGVELVALQRFVLVPNPGTIQRRQADGWSEVLSLNDLKGGFLASVGERVIYGATDVLLELKLHWPGQTPPARGCVVANPHGFGFGMGTPGGILAVESPHGHDELHWLSPR
ncbi:MAG: hypothetical protein U1E65_27260 [Myxococcota bacterium]